MPYKLPEVADLDGVNGIYIKAPMSPCPRRMESSATFWKRARPNGTGQARPGTFQAGQHVLPPGTDTKKCELAALLDSMGHLAKIHHLPPPPLPSFLLSFFPSLSPSSYSSLPASLASAVRWLASTPDPGFRLPTWSCVLPLNVTWGRCCVLWLGPELPPSQRFDVGSNHGPFYFSLNWVDSPFPNCGHWGL